MNNGLIGLPQIPQQVNLFRQATAPKNASIGDVWFDTVNGLWFYWTGSQWTLTNQIWPKNIIVNGRMNVWQRAAPPIVAIADSTIMADRFRYGKSGAVTHTINQSTDIPTVSQGLVTGSSSLHLDCTAALTTVAAGEYTTIQYVVTGYDFQRIAQQYFTLSFWVKATKTGTYSVSFRNSGLDRSYVAEFTVNTSLTWEKKTITVPPSPSSGTWFYTHVVGMYINWQIACGTTLQTAQVGKWISSNAIASSNQVNGVDSTNNDFYLTNVQLQEGSLATPMINEDYSTELHRCQYYLMAYGYSSLFERIGVGQAIGTGTAFADIFLPVSMRTLPTLAITSAGNYYLSNSAGAAQQCNTIAINFASPNVINLQITTVATPLVAGNAVEFGKNNNTTDRLVLNAEL